MCGRYVISSKVEVIEKRFQVKASSPDLFGPNYNVCPGQYAPIITSEQRQVLGLGVFGFSPSWSEKRLYLINARSEGDGNPSNDPMFTGAKGIILKPSFRNAIRKRRCIIPADAFIEGPEKEKLSKPFVVYLNDKKRPFGLAGIYEDWTNKETGEVIRTFAIITTTATKLLQEIGHHRSPVILDTENENTWLDEKADLGEVTQCLHPYDDSQMNAYPISPAIKKPGVNELSLLTPIGERLRPEYEFTISEEIRLEGMGMTPARRRNLE